MLDEPVTGVVAGVLTPADEGEVCTVVPGVVAGVLGMDTAGVVEFTP